MPNPTMIDDEPEHVGADLYEGVQSTRAHTRQPVDIYDRFSRADTRESRNDERGLMAAILAGLRRKEQQ